MVNTNRNLVIVPSFFFTEDYQTLQKEITSFYKTHRNKRAQREYNIKATFDTKISHSLYELFNGRCAYCETYIGEKLNQDIFIDRFRPSNNAKNKSSKEISFDHYWWLTYKWENLYPSCKDCQRFKGNNFPVKNKRAPLETAYENIDAKEYRFLIDPCVDNPSTHFDFDFETGKIIPQSIRGSISIEAYGLNRKSLISERGMIINNYKIKFEQIQKTLKTKSKEYVFDQYGGLFLEWLSQLYGELKINHLSLRIEILEKEFKYNKVLFLLVKDFSKFIKDYNKEHKISNNLKLNDFEKLYGKQHITNPQYNSTIENSIEALNENLYLDKIEFKNFKCFSDLTINFPENTFNDKQEPWMAFLGENASGKSSILKGIAIGLMGQDYLDTLKLPLDYLLKRGKRTGYIKIYGKNNDDYYEVVFSKKNGIKSNSGVPPIFIIGYGATRLLPSGLLKPEKNTIEKVKLKNLFEPSVSLSPAIDWLINVDLKTFNQVSKTLKNILLLDEKDKLKRSKSKNKLFIEYHISGEKENIEDLSDGYKSTLALSVDIIYTLSKEHVIYKEANAIILIDEIGTHLHPRWKMEVIERLRKAFPKSQFIITTHEPLCIKGLYQNEIIVLKRQENRDIKILTELPNPKNFRVDQLLTSDFFGLNSTIDIATEKIFNEYYSLLAIDLDNRTDSQKQRIDELRRKVPSKEHLSGDVREELVYYVIDELLAKQIKKDDLKIINDKIKSEAIKKVQSIWRFIENENKI